MTIKELSDKLEGKFEVSSIHCLTSYVVKLKDAGTVTVNYTDGAFKKLIIQGQEEAQLFDLLRPDILEKKRIAREKKEYFRAKALRQKEKEEKMKEVSQ